uniref:Uncharacterized protein n=1 Tax=Opuntia streptacantha TaxID=393608 RepID=A0A7C9AXB8_OPUST
MDRIPTLTGKLVAIWVIPRRMKDRYANFTIRIDVRMPNLRCKPHSWRVVWIIFWKRHNCIEKTSLIKRILRSNNGDAPLKKIVLIHQSSGEPIYRVLAKISKLLLEK